MTDETAPLAAQHAIPTNEVDLEKLIDAAEVSIDEQKQAQAIAEGDYQPDVNPLSVAAECKLCKKPTHVVCPTCHTAHCADHASNVDPRYCQVCLDEPALTLRVAPLKGADGVTHAGRQLFAEGPAYKTLTQTVSEMTEQQLEGYIDHYRALVHQAETLLDKRRTILGMSQIELAQKKDAQRRHLRSIPMVKRPKTEAELAAAAANPKKPKAAPFTDLGIGDDALLKMLAMISQLPNKK